MPSTPFIGLSVMVHLVVISIYKIFGYDATTKNQRSMSKNLSASRRISFVIISSVFTIITINAGMLIHTAVADKHSSINFVEHVAQDLANDETKDKKNYYSTPNNQNYSTLNYII